MKYLNFILISVTLLTACPTTDNLTDTEDSVITLPEYTHSSGSTYYVSNSGNDNNSGLTTSNPWKTISKVNSVALSAGDVVLFKSGDTFRGQLKPASGSQDNWIKYSNYDVGSKPKIVGEYFSTNGVNWLDKGANIWELDYQSDKGAYQLILDSITTTKKWDKSELTTTGDYYFDYTVGYLYLYSIGNPSVIYTNIEVRPTTHIIDMANTSYILFENLHLTDGSAHGFGGANTDHLIIRNCEFSYIGGGVLSYYNNEYIKYGNGIEFWGNAQNNLVERNKFWEIYDTAVTNQNHTSTTKQKNIYYINNIISNCGLASFELWNRPEASTLENIYFVNNTSIDPGHGWGSDRPDKNSYHIASFGSTAKTNNLVIKNNIFYSSSTPEGVDNVSNFHLFFLDEDKNDSYSKYLIDYNLWSMPAPLWAITTDVSYNTFVSWQDVNGQSEHGLTQNPLFLDFDNGDFSLSSNSPCIDAGTETFRTTDFYGNSVIGIPDIGAIED